MYTVGLTGGIASGKSEAARDFADCGAAVIDTDALAREVLRPGSDGLAAVAAEFGRDFLRPDGSLDRAKMRRLVFSDPGARRRLEEISHPRIRALLHERLRALSGPPYAIVEIPLLVESGLARELDRILVIDAPEALQMERLMRRDGESEPQATEALQAQGPRRARLALADDVIVNDGGRDALREAVRGLHERYARMAGAARAAP